MSTQKTRLLKLQPQLLLSGVIFITAACLMLISMQYWQAQVQDAESFAIDSMYQKDMLLTEHANQQQDLIAVQTELAHSNAKVVDAQRTAINAVRSQTEVASAIAQTITPKTTQIPTDLNDAEIHRLANVVNQQSVDEQIALEYATTLISLGYSALVYERVHDILQRRPEIKAEIEFERGQHLLDINWSPSQQYVAMRLKHIVHPNPLEVDNELIIVEMTNGEITHRLRHPHYISAARWSSDSTQILTESAQKIRIWDVATGEILQQFDISNRGVEFSMAKSSPPVNNSE